MRQLKFRIWDKKNKNWITENNQSLHCFSNWSICPFTGKLTDYVGVFDGDHGETYIANPAPDYYITDSTHERNLSTFTALVIREPRYVIQQYTGLKDKNGKEIYEGDIIETMYDVSCFKLKNGEILEGAEPGHFMIEKPVLSKVKWSGVGFDLGGKIQIGWRKKDAFKVVGNVFENSNLLSYDSH